MKIVHISASDIGGAGSAAIRLHKGLLEQQIDSKFLCLDKYVQEEEVYGFKRRPPLNILKRKVQNFGIPLTQKKANEIELNKYNGDYEIFTFPNTDFDILNVPIVKQADIINLHWVADFLDYQSFFKEINKPIVWTLHDKNPTLGGFHLLLDKERNPSFSLLENRLAKIKYSVLSKVANLTVVSPSKFLMNYSSESKNLGNFEHYHIPNSIDTSVFKPHEQNFAKGVFSLPLNKKIVLFLDSASYHKGTDLVLECINSQQFNDVQFVALGCAYTLHHQAVINLKQLVEERLMALLYSASDLFLLPSREDNLPNMMLESLACGTPVLGSSIGGINDVIRDGFNGFIMEELSANVLNIGIANFLKRIKSFDRNSIRDSVVEYYDISVQAKKYKSLYEAILKNES